MNEQLEFEAQPTDVEVRFLRDINPRDKERILAAASWNNPGLFSGFRGRVGYLEPLEMISFERVCYDTLALSGVGYRPFVMVTTTAGRHSSNIVKPVSKDNFVPTRPSLFKTPVVVDGKIIERKTDYCPNGGYTKDQAEEKLENTERILVSNGREFCVPLPVAIGWYPQIVLPDGSNPHFLVFAEPDHGRRLDFELLMAETHSKGTVGEFFEYFLKRGRIIAGGLLNLNNLGYVHGQPYPGNLAVLNSNGKPYFADFESLGKISPTDEYLARALDLKLLISRYIGLYMLVIKNIQLSRSFDVQDFFDSFAGILDEDRLNIALDMTRIYLGKLDLEVDEETLSRIIGKHEGIFSLAELLEKERLPNSN